MFVPRHTSQLSRKIRDSGQRSPRKIKNKKLKRKLRMQTLKESWHLWSGDTSQPTILSSTPGASKCLAKGPSSTLSKIAASWSLKAISSGRRNPSHICSNPRLQTTFWLPDCTLTTMKSYSWRRMLLQDWVRYTTECQLSWLRKMSSFGWIHRTPKSLETFWETLF